MRKIILLILCLILTFSFAFAKEQPKQQPKKKVDYEAVHKANIWFSEKIDEIFIAKGRYSTEEQFTEIFNIMMEAVAEDFKNGKTVGWCNSIATCKANFLTYWDATNKYTAIDRFVKAEDMKHIYREYAKAFFMIIKASGGTPEGYVKWVDENIPDEPEEETEE